MNKKDDTAQKSVNMVDISSKPKVLRTAEADGTIYLSYKTIDALRNGTVSKGDVFATAEIAGILAAKKTYELIPLCHPIPLTSVQLSFNLMKDCVKVTCIVNANYKTGVEMEALTGVSVALLTIWDMVKKMEKDSQGQYATATIEHIRVVKKVKAQ